MKNKRATNRVDQHAQLKHIVMVENSHQYLDNDDGRE